MKLHEGDIPVHMVGSSKLVGFLHNGRFKRLEDYSRYKKLHNENLDNEDIDK